MTRAGEGQDSTTAPDVRGSTAGSGRWRRPRALLFDLDGTLYWQQPLRLLMAAELLSLGLRSGAGALRALQEYRRQGERLRGAGAQAGTEPLARQQVTRAAAKVGWEADRLERLVEEWMQLRPLKYLRPLRRRGLLALLELLRGKGIAAGVLSDYPVAEKLRALGLEGRFSPTLCTTAPEIDALKPHPRGFQRACTIWGLRPDEVLYVGDRADVDAVGARNAGMGCCLVSPLPLSGFGRLLRLLEEHG